MSISYNHSAPVRSAAPSWRWRRMSAAWRWRRSVAAWLGLALLTLTVFANGAMPAPAKEVTTPVEQQLFGDRIVICTPGGLIVVDQDGNPVSTDDNGQHANICVFCLPLMHAGIDAPATADLVPPPPVEVLTLQRPPAHAAFLRALIDPGAASPRGPPTV
ncbi:MAG TPA: hypothetical protein PKZ97_05250 [Azospirillaceae bacterium]|nr:hypothetical protein [Azospirillaceae bacterium]